jgi:hypothetical protein
MLSSWTARAKISEDVHWKKSNHIGSAEKASELSARYTSIAWSFIPHFLSLARGIDMSVVTLSEVVRAFSSSYETLDVRIVALRLEDKWINVITSIFLSGESEEKIESKQQQMRSEVPRGNDGVSVFLTHSSAKSIHNYLDRIKNGEPILVEGIEVRFRQLDPYVLTVESLLPNFLRGIEEWKLAGSQTQGKEEERSRVWPILETQNRQAKLRGYRDIYELINETLGLTDFNRGTTRDFVVGIPMPARILQLSLTDSSMNIQIKKLPGLRDLQLNLSLRKATRVMPYQKTMRRIAEPIIDSEQLTTEKCSYVTNSIELAEIRDSDWIDVELIHRQVPTLSMDNTNLTVSLQNPSEPLAKTLSGFCSLDLLKERLLNPEKFKKPGIEFEDATEWLLSLIGFAVVRLGRFEKLKVQETNYEVGSIDIIAYKENECILLVDCDTSVPDEKKIRSVASVKDHLKFIQDEYKRLRLVSLVFSPKDCTGITVNYQDFKIVDKHQITQLFEEMMKGDIERAQSSLVY